MSSVFKMDMNELRKIPELAMEVDVQDHNLSILTEELAADEARFRERADTHVADARAEDVDDPYKISEFRFYEAVEAAYAEHLQNWLEARNVLVREALRVVAEDNQQMRLLDSLSGVLSRIRGIRRLYISLEIVAPILFALVAVAYTLR